MSNAPNVAHGYHLFKDGTAWCAVGPHFIDLMKSDAGFGETQAEAVADLHVQMSMDPWWNNKTRPTLDKFTVHQP
jgi:hypothetical protein